MRETDFNTGLRGVLFESRHYARMGAAVWLYGWLVLRQTHQSAGVGYVLGGAPVTYREIEEETGFNRRTLETWMRVLRREGYIETQTLPGGVGIRILRAKKHRPNAPGYGATRRASTSQQEIFPENLRDSSNQHASTAVVRDQGRGARGFAESGPRTDVVSERELQRSQRVAAPISSSSVVRIKEIQHQEIHTRVENQNSAKPEPQRELFTASEDNSLDSKSETNPSCLEQTQEQFSLFENRSDRSCAATPPYESPNTYVSAAKLATPIGSQNHARADQPRTNNFPWELRKRMQLLRAEREEEVRRELYVGTGPEGRRR